MTYTSQFTADIKNCKTFQSPYSNTPEEEQIYYRDQIKDSEIGAKCPQTHGRT